MSNFCGHPLAELSKSKQGAGAENEWVGERALDERKKGGRAIKKGRGGKADQDSQRPPVLLSNWPKAHLEPAATDDITV